MSDQQPATGQQQQPEQNGTIPEPETWEPAGEPDLDLVREVRLLARALEDADMRLQTIQVMMVILCAYQLVDVVINTIQKAKAR